MKKSSCLIMGLALLMGFCTLPAQAANNTDNIKITVDGQPIADAYAVLWNEKNSRIMIRAEFFEEYFGAEVNASQNEAIISKNGHTLSFKALEDTFIMDNIGGQKLESANFVKDGAFYVPLRLVCEALGGGVSWEGAANAAVVNTDVSTLPEAAKPYLKNVQLFDQATIRITGEKTIYIDPRGIKGELHDADIILITHPHGDHFEIDSIKKLTNDKTVLYVTEDAAEKAAENGFVNVKTVMPYNEYTEGGISFKTVPAYNTSDTRQNHKKESNWVGYIVTADSVTYYAAGDTDYIPDMDGLKPDVAFLPIDGRYNMEEKEAATAANAIKPKVAVPYHYNNFSAQENALDFISMLDDGIMGVVLTFKMF